MLAALPVIMGFQFLLQTIGLDIQGQPVQCRHRELSVTSDEANGSPDTVTIEQTEAQPAWQHHKAA
jgi:hypothetical protein